jgi:D-tagatose-1,6-bisphosphate aldolase subunit GatZ/KbaZ
LGENGVPDAWPCFIVGKVGTDLSTTTFDRTSALRLRDRVRPSGSLIKGHYTDWVADRKAYPATGMGGANVGPEFTATELAALKKLCQMESRKANISPSGFLDALEEAVIVSNRWKKWLQAEEKEAKFGELKPERREWLVATGARYIWTQPGVLSARQKLYANLSAEINAHEFVIDQIAANIQLYVDDFNLRDSIDLLQN